MIARLNIGGTSIQAITLTKQLEGLGYSTTLVRGREDAHEGTMDHLADELGVTPLLVPSLRRNPGWRDLRALLAMVRIIRRERPMLVHTHAAKGGTLGRVASILASAGRRRRAVVVHTFHGHSLTGYFSPATAAVYRAIERLLASQTDALIAVSEQVRDELVTLGVAPAERFEVVPLGLDLSRFDADHDTRVSARATARKALGVAADAKLVTLIARLVPIKRVDRFLRAGVALSDLPDARFMVVGDGQLRDALQASPEARALGDRLIWTGFRRDIPELCFASDIVALTSENEGTPVSLIEAGAAGLPTLSTDVGGAAKVIRDGETGILVGPDDGDGLVQGLRVLLSDDGLRGRMGAAARSHVLSTFTLERLIYDLDRLYVKLLAERR